MKVSSDLRRAYPKGCMPPSGYCAWHSWAATQAAHGLKQIRCKRCWLFLFPQEFVCHTCTPREKPIIEGLS